MGGRILIVNLSKRARRQAVRALRNSGHGFSVTHVVDDYNILTHLQRTGALVVVLGCRSKSGNVGSDVGERIRHDPDSHRVGILLADPESEKPCHDCPMPSGGDHCVDAKLLHLEKFVRNVAGLAAKASLRESGCRQRGPVTLNREDCSLRILGRLVQLTSTAFEIIWALSRRPGHVVEKSALCGRSGRPVTKWDIDSLYSNVRRLRIALGPDRDLVASVHGEGYRMDLDWQPR